MGQVRLRKYADKSQGKASKVLDLPGAPPGTWPTDHVGWVDDPPAEAVLSQGFVLRGLQEGWIDGAGHRVVTRPAGPAEDPWMPTGSAPAPHTFHHFDALIVAGARYRVVHQPDKYVDGDDEAEVTAKLYRAGRTRVDWFYRLALDE